MLPIRDDIPSRRFPAVTLGLVVLNVLVFLWELRLGRHLGQALLNLSIIPIRYTDPEVAHLFSPVEQAVPFLSSMFLHGGWVHLAGNLWTLWVFGDNVEDRLGPGRFLGFYVAGGVAASLLHIYTNPGSHLPTIGASGAVAAVMGAYFRFYPQARVQTLIPPFFLGPFLVLPAVVFLGWWFLLQFFSGALSLTAGRHDFGGVAWWAHVGGVRVRPRRVPPGAAPGTAPASEPVRRLIDRWSKRERRDRAEPSARPPAHGTRAKAFFMAAAVAAHAASLSRSFKALLNGSHRTGPS